ncbi:MAG: dTMP kinase [Candidatus Micrarchaeia archaeon]
MPLIVIEGLNGTGKSTVANEVASVLGATIMKIPASDFMTKLKAYFDMHPEETVARTLYFMWAAEDIGRKAANILRKNPDNIVILDRYWYTTYAAQRAYEIAYNSGRNLEEIDRIIDETKARMLVPDAIVYIYVQPAIRDLRLAMRREADKRNDKWHSGDAKLYYAFEKEYKRLFEQLEKEGANVIRIDNSGDISKTVSNTLEQLNRSVFARKKAPTRA